jgi:hypothetical protein
MGVFQRKVILTGDDVLVSYFSYCYCINVNGSIIYESSVSSELFAWLTKKTESRNLTKQRKQSRGREEQRLKGQNGNENEIKWRGEEYKRKEKKKETKKKNKYLTSCNMNIT